MTTATDKYRFDCVYKGAWYWLGSLSDHLKHKVPAGKSLLIDFKTYQTRIVPQSEVHIPLTPLA